MTKKDLERGRLHNEELHSLYRSPNVVRVIKSWSEMMFKGYHLWNKSQNMDRG